MNTAKITALQPVFRDMLGQLTPGRCLVSMMENQLRAELLLTGRRQSVALRDLDHPAQVYNFVGVASDDHLHDFVPARVFAWVEQQLPATLPDEVRWLLPAAGWQARLQAAPSAVAGRPGQLVPPAAPGVYLEHQISPEVQAVLARGLRAYQTKRRKQARRLVAQSLAFHLQQLVAVGSQEGKEVQS